MSELFMAPSQWRAFKEHTDRQDSRITLLEAKVAGLKAERDALRDAVERVRGVCDDDDYGRIFAEYGRDAELIRVVPLSAVLRALDGGDDDD